MPKTVIFDVDGTLIEFLTALKRLGNPDARNVIVVGDTPYDAGVAGEAGLCTTGVLCGGFPELAEEGAS